MLLDLLHKCAVCKRQWCGHLLVAPIRLMATLSRRFMPPLYFPATRLATSGAPRLTASSVDCTASLSAAPRRFFSLRCSKVVRCDVVRCGVVRCGVVRCGVMWCGVMWCGVVRCDVMWWVYTQVGL